MRPSGFLGAFRDDVAARAVYSEGAGIARAMPRAIAVPADADDVARLISWAHATRTAIIPRGSGSGMAGGAVGTDMVVDLSRLTGIDPVNMHGQRIFAGAGALRADVNASAQTAGLRFPVDPSSGAFCTVGGMASTNAAGARSLRFGPTRSWVSALDCVFDDGTRAIVRRGEPAPENVPALARFLDLMQSAPQLAFVSRRRARKESSGYGLADYAESGELIDLLVGSEGSLALFVAVELQLAPQPLATSSVLAAFRSLDATVTASAYARDAGASACELLDRTFLEFAALGSTSRLDSGTEAALLIEAEGATPSEAAILARTIADACAALRATRVDLALDARTEAAIWELRHAASPILSRLDPHLKSMQFIEDGAVPPGHLAEYVTGIRGVLASRGLRGVLFGHAGDAHVHVNPLIDVRLPDWRERLDAVLNDATSLVARLGGTLSGEHGDGRLRTPLLPRVRVADEIRAFEMVKSAFDPIGILNPGVTVALDGQRPIDTVKYDPEAPPLPAAARRALDTVERERGYARFRLSLLADSA